MDKVNRTNGLAIPVAIGVIFFLYIFGYQPLNVYSHEWLGGGDALQNYLGWQFFRQAHWSFPVIGMSLGYGMDVGSSIVFSDSNPLLAVFFKALSPLLPETFQYFGLWLVACCVLQSYFLWKMISLFTDNSAIKFFSVVLMMFNPAWINRIGHINLMGHFLVLAAIYLVLSNNSKGRIVKWTALMMVAFAVHFYLALMVSVVWGANIFARLVTRSSSVKSVLKEAVIVLSLTVLTMYVLGYFTVGSVAASGEFGFYHNNLLSFLVSNGWSHFFNIKGFGSSSFESLNFWGTGVLVLLIIGSIGIIRMLKSTKLSAVTLTFWLCLPVFLIIATTNVIAFGRHQFVIDLPYQVINALSVVRASARFFWPVTYCAMVLILAGVLKSFSHKVALTVIALAAALQVYDTAHGYNKDRFYFYKTPPATFTLVNKFWSEDVKNYSAIRYIPFQNMNKPWYQLAFIAEQNKVATDAVYLARYSDVTMGKMNRKTLSELALGKYDPKVVYVIRDDLVDKVSLRHGDKILRIDGLNVLAPGMNSCVECKEMKNQRKNDAYIFKSNWLGKGILGDWNDGLITTVLVESASEDVCVRIGYKAFTPSQVKQQRLIFKVNGETIKDIRADRNGEVTLSWKNRAGSKTSVLTIDTPDAIAPRSIGMNTDGRLISISIDSLSFE